MAAGEDELQPLVRECRRVHLLLRRLWHLKQAGLGGQGAIATNPIDGPVARRGD
jgi:hypothetical protein